MAEYEYEPGMESKCYELIIGTAVTDADPNPRELAVARAVASLREGWILEIHSARTFGGGESQYGVRLEVLTYEPPEVFERYAETVEQV